MSIVRLAWLLVLLAPACRSKEVPHETGVVEDSGMADTEAGEDSSKPEDTGPFDSDGDGVNDDEDCNDELPGVHPGADEICDGLDNDCDGVVDEEDAVDASIWYADTDGDGYGDAAVEQVGCDQPPGFSHVASDCDDNDPRYHPGAAEEDCTDPADYNCDGSVGWADDDGDSFAACEDCDDSSASVNENAAETCDGIDNDCDGVTDEDDAVDAATWHADADGDGYGGSQFVVTACAAPPGYVDNTDDCNDLDATSYPGGAEVCDGVDNDCDALVDDADTDRVGGGTWYSDGDGDGYGNPVLSATSCDAASGWTADGTDCDDTAPTIFPGAAEICDGLDNDCDSLVDDDDPNVIGGTTWVADLDGDGHGGSSLATTACSQPSGFVATSDDCNDFNPNVSPSSAEVCNTIDDDCDGDIDDADASLDASSASPYYADADGDGYGDAAAAQTACIPPTGHVADATDCDDTDSNIHPGAAEFCDNVDYDCDGTTNDAEAIDVLTWYPDADGDGYGDASGATQACSQPTSHVSQAQDCDDSSAAINPLATEVCDSIDNDCDGDIDATDPDVDLSSGTLFFQDSDSDGYGDPLASTWACTQGAGEVADSSDCDDSNGNIRHCQTCQQALDSGTHTSTGQAALDLDGDGSTESVLCDQATEGGGWMRCAWIDYVAETSTTTYDAAGNVIASSSTGSTLGSGGTQAIKSACFDLVDEVGFGVTHAVGGSAGGPYDFEYWGEVGAPVSGSDTFAFVSTGGPNFSCGNATSIDLTWLSYPDSLPRWFLFGADNGSIHSCYRNGTYSGATYGIWAQFETTTVGNTWVEVSDTHFDRMGTITPNAHSIHDGVLEFWVR